MEEMYELYSQVPSAKREAITASFFPDEAGRKQFESCMAICRMFHDPEYYAAMKAAVQEMIVKKFYPSIDTRGTIDEIGGHADEN